MSDEVVKLNPSIQYYVTSAQDSRSRLLVRNILVGGDFPVRKNPEHLYPQIRHTEKWDRAYIYSPRYDSVACREKNAEWRFEPIGNGNYHITSVANGGDYRLLSIREVESKSWERAYLYHRSYDAIVYDSVNAQWRVERVPGKQTYRIINAGSGARLLTREVNNTWDRGYVYRKGYDDYYHDSKYAEWELNPTKLQTPVKNPYTNSHVEVVETKSVEVKESKLIVYVALGFAATAIALRISGVQAGQEVLSADLVNISKGVLIAVSILMLALRSYENLCEGKSVLSYSLYNANCLFASLRDTSEGSHDLIDSGKQALGVSGVGKAIEYGCKLLSGG